MDNAEGEFCGFNDVILTADIFTLADENYVDGIEPSFGSPTGGVFMAEVIFIYDITSNEAQYFCLMARSTGALPPQKANSSPSALKPVHWTKTMERSTPTP